MVMMVNLLQVDGWYVYIHNSDERKGFRGCGISICIRINKFANFGEHTS